MLKWRRSRINQNRPRSGRSTKDFGAALAHNIVMLNFGAANLIGGLIFGSVGFVAFTYGKRMSLWQPMFIGLALMIYPYFVSSDIVLWIAGIAGSASLWFVRN